MYHPDTPFPLWCVQCHLSDIWDARDYAREYDFSRNFFEQFKELKYSIPHRALDQNERNLNCEYSNFTYSSKDVYLSFNTVRSEHIKYCKDALYGNKNCLDSLTVRENDRGYELVKSNGNYNSSFLVESDQCIDSHFLYDCSNCNNCCLSSNLRNKSYCFKNEQLSPEEYKKAIASLHLETYSGQQEARKMFAEFSEKAIHKHAYIKNSVNAVGDRIENSKNIQYAYGLEGAENVKYAYLGEGGAKDSQDVVYVGKLEQCYEFTVAGRGAARSALSLSCGGGSSDTYYSDGCRSCSNCFGCVNLLKKEYCIFNKQYSKEEYFEVIEKIKKQMNEIPYRDSIGRKYIFGDFFPSELSPFCYNETLAFEEVPLSKERALTLGYKWREPEEKVYAPTITSGEIPDNIHDVPDTITNEIIECPHKGKIETRCVSAYRILPDELAFYRQMNVPIPRYCPNCRYHDRLKWKNPFRFYKRQCMCSVSSHEHGGMCSNEFETMYAPDRPEIIYCKECYQKEIY